MAKQPAKTSKTERVEKLEQEPATLDAIAETLVTLPEEQDSEEISADAENADSDQEGVEASGDTADEAEEVPSEGDLNDEAEEETLEAESDAEEEDLEESEEEPEYLDIEDDVEIEIMVDGELETRTLGELKKLASGEGAIEKRLEEATTLRKESHSHATQMLEYLGAQDALYKEALDNLDSTVYAEFIPAPDEKLQDTNPAAYIKHKKAYDSDQKRIKNAKQAIERKIKELNDARQERLQQYAQASAQRVQQDIPELFDKDQKVRDAKFNALKETAMRYDFSEAEIANAYDYRMFNLIAAAHELEMLKGKQKETRDVKDLTQQKTKKVRRLRSGGTTAKNRARQQSKQREAVKARAQKTGKVQDVAATLIQ